MKADHSFFDDPARYWHAHAVGAFAEAKTLVAFRQKHATDSVHNLEGRRFCRHMIAHYKARIIELAQRLELVMGANA